MSYLVQVSNTFFEVCALLASGIKTVTEGANYVIQLNYNVVATVCTGVYTVISTIFGTVSQVWSGLQNALGYLTDFLGEIYSLIASVVFCVWKFFVGVYSIVDSSCLKVLNFFTSCAYHISHAYLTMKQTAVDGYEGVSNLCYLIASNISAAVTSVFIFVTSVGNFSVNFVTGAWQGLGYVLSSIAYFPIYCVESVESVKERLTNFVVHAVTVTPKETYLGIVCLCLLYFMLSNTFRYLSCRGMPLFSSRIGTRRRGQRFEWHFDRGFESDFEDLYNSDDTDDRVWRTVHNTAADSDDSDNDDGSDENNDGNDSNDSGTMDNDISDDEDADNSDVDDESDDNNTVATEESDSDASLNSHTFSNESSDHEIEVQLPTQDERYSLRSRSSTPSRHPKPCNSPEEFDREMERERDKRKCVVCQDQIKSVLVLPCRHMCMCVECADHIVRSRFVGRRVCPLCRTRIQKVMNVYV